MSNRASASRYAKALFEVAIAEGGLDQIDQALGSFASLMQANDELRTTLLNPSIPASAKRGIVSQVLAPLAPPAPLLKVLALLADRDRLELVPALAETYRDRVMEHQRIVQAEIVTADELDEARVTQLQAKLAEVTGQTVRLSRRVDPAILGGMVARIGSTVFDGSIATQLAKLRHQLNDSM